MNPQPTNPMFVKFDQALGTTNPTLSHAPVQSRANEIRSIAQTAKTTAGNNDTGSLGIDDPNADKFFGGIGAAATKYVGVPLAQGVINAGTAVKNRIQGNFDTAIQHGQEDANKPTGERLLGAGAEAAHGTIDTLVGGGADIVTNLVAPFIPQKVKDIYGQETDRMMTDIQATLNEPKNAEIKNTIVSLAQSAKEHPLLARATGDLINVMLAAAGGEGAAAAKTSTETAVNAGADAAQAGIRAGTSAVNNVVSSVNPTTVAGSTGGDVVGALAREGEQVTPEAAQTSAWKDVQPKDTTGTKLAYAKQGNVGEQGVFKGAELQPSTADKALIDTQSKLYEDGTLKEGMSANEKQAAVKQKAAQLNQQQKEFLASHDKGVNLTQRDGSGLYDKLDSVAQESSMPFSKDAASKGAYDSAMDTFKQYLKLGKDAGTTKGASTLSAVDAALTKFDAAMEKFGAFKKTATGEIADSAKARTQAIEDIHTAVRDFISDNLPPNSPWKSIRSQESNLYSISDRLASQIADTVGSSQVGQFMKNTPVAKAAVKAVGLGAGLHLVP